MVWFYFAHQNSILNHRFPNETTLLQYCSCVNKHIYTNGLSQDFLVIVLPECFFTLAQEPCITLRKNYKTIHVVIGTTLLCKIYISWLTIVVQLNHQATTKSPSYTTTTCFFFFFFLQNLLCWLQSRIVRCFDFIF